MRKFMTVAVLALAAITLAGPAAAHYHVNTSSGVLLEGGPLALRGYDAVAYFTQSKPVQGNHKFTAVHDGAVYQFSSEANKKAFAADPAKYAPAYGGYCAFGVSLGKKFDGDPSVWKIVDGKLYLNLNSDVQQTWEKDTKGNITKATGNWPKISSAAPESLK